MKSAEAIEAPLFNGNGWANTSLIQSDPLQQSYCFILHFHMNSNQQSSKVLSITPGNKQSQIDFHAAVRLCIMSGILVTLADLPMSRVSSSC